MRAIARADRALQVIGDDLLVTNADSVEHARAIGALQCGADQAEPGGDGHRDATRRSRPRSAPVLRRSSRRARARRKTRRSRISRSAGTPDS